MSNLTQNKPDAKDKPEKDTAEQEPQPAKEETLEEYIKRMNEMLFA